MERVLEGKVAIVTGSGQGIGREIALCFAKHGAKVITNNRKPGSSINAFEKTSLDFSEKERKELLEISGDAQTTADEIISFGGEAIPFFGDVSDFNTTKQVIDLAIEKFGRIDIIVHNASSNWVGSFLDMDEKLWDISIDSKLKGAFNLMHHALPHMLKNGYGRILNSSSDAHMGIEGYAAYGAANAGINTLSKALSKELLNTGVTVNAYTPLARTRAWMNAAAKYRLQGVPEEVINQNVPAAMRNTAEGMVPFLAYLASDKAADISGHLFKLSSDGEVGLWSSSAVVKSVFQKDAYWTIDKLEKVIPGDLLADIETAGDILKMK